MNQITVGDFKFTDANTIYKEVGNSIEMTHSEPCRINPTLEQKLEKMGLVIDYEKMMSKDMIVGICSWMNKVPVKKRDTLTTEISGVGTVTSLVVKMAGDGVFVSFVCGTPSAQKLEIKVFDSNHKLIARLRGPEGSNTFRAGQPLEFTIGKE